MTAVPVVECITPASAVHAQCTQRQLCGSICCACVGCAAPFVEHITTTRANTRRQRWCGDTWLPRRLCCVCRGAHNACTSSVGCTVLHGLDKALSKAENPCRIAILTRAHFDDLNLTALVLSVGTTASVDKRKGVYSCKKILVGPQANMVVWANEATINTTI